MAEETKPTEYNFAVGSPRRLLDKSKRLEALEEFKGEFEKYIKDQQDRLEAEKAFLEMVLKNQGLGFVTRRSSSEMKLRSLAYMQQFSLGDFLNDKTKVITNFAEPSEEEEEET